MEHKQQAPGWLAVLAGCRQGIDQVSGQLSATTPVPVRIDRELDDGEELAFGGGAVMVAVPGHTRQRRFYLPGTQALFAGDTVART